MNLPSLPATLSQLQSRQGSNWRLALRNIWVGLDSSGKFDSTSVGYCGYFAEVDTWEIFDRTWKGALKGHHLDALHTKDAMNWRGEFCKKREEWKDQADAEREALLMDFARIIRSHAIEGIGLAVATGHIKHDDGKMKRRDFKMFEMLLEVIANRTMPEDRIAILHDNEQDAVPYIYSHWQRLRNSRRDIAGRITLIGFGNDEAYGQLQAADLFAYFSRIELDRLNSGGTEPEHPVHKELTRDIHSKISLVPFGQLFTETFFKSQFPNEP